MAEEMNEHIDDLFRKEFANIDVRFNEAHWQNFAAFMAANAAASAAQVAKESLAKKLLKIFFRPNIWLTLVISGTIVAGIIYNMKNDAENPIQSTPVSLPQVLQISTAHDSAHHISHDSAHRFTNTSQANQDFNERYLTDTIRSVLLNKTDSIDSLHVDSLKLKNNNFIFWY